MWLRRVIHLGASEAVTIPTTLTHEHGIKTGDYVFVSAVRDGILIQKAIEGTDATRIIAARHDKRASTRR